MPKLVPVVTKNERMRRTRQDDELPVGVWQLAKEVEQILLARDPVMLAAYHHDRRVHFQRIDGRRCAVISR